MFLKFNRQSQYINIIMTEKESPIFVTSKRHIIYKKSSWCIHNFEVWSGEQLCRVSVVKMNDSVLLWIGAGSQNLFGEMAVGMPAQSKEWGPLSSSLHGAEVGAAPLARQLAIALKKPIYVCCGDNFDRFTMPLVVQGLIAEIKSRPECF